MTIVDDPPRHDIGPLQVRVDKQQAGLWRSIWRWHFYAGIFVMPVLLTLAVTGLGILVKPTLERALYGDRLYVDRTEQTVPYAQQIAAVQGSYPGATVRAITPPPHDHRSTQIDVTTIGGQDISVYVDPSNGHVLGGIENTHRLNNVLEKIHGTLWAGTLGDYFIELIAGWTLVMMASGMYLWWPRPTRSGNHRWRNAFRIRLRRTSSRRRLRDLHATPSAVFAGVVFVLVLTGLPWSGFWGKYWAKMSDAIGAGSHAPETPTSDQLAGSIETEGLTVAWASDRQEVPRSPTPVHAQGSSDDHYHAAPDDRSTALPTSLSIEDVHAIGRHIGMAPGFSIGLPEGPTGVYTLSSSWPSVASAERTAFVDQYRPTVLTDHGWTHYGPLAKATSFGVDTHMGRQFGPLNAIVLAGTCFAIIGAIITAPLMWWKRRDRGATGFPRRPVDLRTQRRVVAIAVTLGVLFPLLGLSMLVVASFDRFILPKLQRRSVAAH